MDSPPHTLDALDRNGTLGMGYLGVVISSLIYGITCIQSLHYYRSPKGQRDPMYTRAFVSAIWILDTVHQGLVVYAFYHYLVTGYGLPATLFYLSWSIPASLIVNNTIFVLIRCFFLMRIWLLSRNVCLAVGLALLALARFGLALSLCGISFLKRRCRLRKTIAIWSLSLEVATTISYTGTLIFYLHRGRSGFRKSDNMVSKILLIVFSSSALSALVAIATLFAYTLAPAKLYNLFFEFILETVDANAVLTSLNSRDFLSHTGAECSALSLERADLIAPPHVGKQVIRHNALQ